MPFARHLERVHGWLAMAGDLGFIPVPIADLSGATLQEHDGLLWELEPWMPGAAEAARPPAMDRVRSAFAAMGALHQRLGGERRDGASPGLAQRLAAVAGLIGGGFDELEQAIGQAKAADPTGPMAERWLALARAIAPRLVEPLRQAAGRVVPLQPCLRDARPEHFLFEGDRLAGLVDFGAMGVDCVAADLARLAGEWLDGFGEGETWARGDALAAYERVRPLGASESALIDIFSASSSLLIGERWIRWHHVEGRPFDDPRAVERGIARGLVGVERLAGDGGLTARGGPGGLSYR